ncbi:MAG: DEAD/DEAH box helicase, partial [Armatimonadota bacterium]
MSHRGEVLEMFHPAVARWFAAEIGQPSPPQELGWPSIAAGMHTLIHAPTGSGKTLAAFLWCLDRCFRMDESAPAGVKVLYVSPLKALNYDIERNLHQPLKGIREYAARLGTTLREVRKAVRTGDTPSKVRLAMAKHPPDILITTPESLYLILTSSTARHMLATVEYCIVDEIHAVCGNKRGT